MKTPSPAASMRAMAAAMSSSTTAMTFAVAWIMHCADSAMATWPGQKSRSPRAMASPCSSLRPTVCHC